MFVSFDSALVLSKCYRRNSVEVSMQRHYDTVFTPRSLVSFLLALICAANMTLAQGDEDVPSVSRMFSKVMPLKIQAHERRTASAATSRANAAKIKSFFADNQELGCGNDGLIVGTSFPCKNMNLTAFLTGEELGSPYAVSTATSVNDVWGWTDSTTGKEYALVGLFDGTSIVDISNPTQPTTVAFLETTTGVVSGLDGFRNIWRDMKVIGDVMYVGSEVSFHGIQTFDLTLVRSPIVASPTPESRPSFFRSIWDFFVNLLINIWLFPLRAIEFVFGFESGLGSAPDPVTGVPIIAPTFVTPEVGGSHNLVAAADAAKIIAVGLSLNDKTCPGAALAIFDISDDPLQPTFDACVSLDDVAFGYVHDAQCINYDGPSTAYIGVNICALFMETAIALYDLDDRSLINSFSYDNAAYTHQGWFSEDHTTLYVDDELDEVDGTSGTSFSTCYIFNVTNLDAEIQPPMQFVTPSEHPSIDHNLYTREGHVYQAAYTSGARVRRILPDTTLEEVAYFDSDLVCECVDRGSCPCDFFGGVWTFFPYFDSGLAVASSDADGLYILRPLL